MDDIKRIIDESPYVVWRGEDCSFSCLPNGFLFRWGDRLYRIGTGDGPEIDSYYPMLRGKLVGPMNEMEEKP